MAKLAVHGAEIGTVYFTTSARRYMSDGHILQNKGFGWKLCHKVRDGESIQEAFAKQVESQKALLANRPHTVAYRKALHSLAGLGNRWKLHMAVEAMPDDCDGVWSQACDGYGDNIHADVDEVGDLCRLYKLAVEEQRAAKLAKQGV